MSRGGRGSFRGRGGKRNGPDISWDDEPSAPPSMAPEPLFPEVPQVTPKSLSPGELNRVKQYRYFRDLVREGPLYTVLEPHSLTDEHGKVNKRAGFNPFEDVPTYSKRYQKPKRTLPDLSTRPYVLKFFPKELWSTLDPKRKNPEWATLGPSLPGGSDINGKRKRVDLPEGEGDEDEEDDEVVAGGRRKRSKKREDPTSRKGQKQGLEAEDDYGPDGEVNEDDADGGEEALQDSEFSESDDGANDDYNAENYFEGGDDDDIDDDGGGGDDFD